MEHTTLKTMVSRCNTPTSNNFQKTLAERIVLSESVGSYDVDKFKSDIQLALDLPLPEKFTVEWFVDFHKLACNQVDEKVGKLRDHIGMAGMHIFPHPQIMTKFFDVFIEELNSVDPMDWNVKWASMAAMKLMAIHPFSYANGITAKILFVKLSGVRTALDFDRQEYVTPLIRSDPDGFYQYCLKNAIYNRCDN